MKNVFLTLVWASAIVWSLFLGITPAMAVQIPPTLPSDFGTQCTGTGYECTTHSIFFDVATSTSDPTITSVGLKRLSCVTGVDATAWLSSETLSRPSSEWLVNILQASNVIQISPNETPSLASPDSYCEWKSYWNYSSGSWTSDHSNGSNIPVSWTPTSGYSMISTFNINASDADDFNGRYGLEAFNEHETIWTTDGPASQSADFAHVITCNSSDVFCQAQKKAFEILDFIFGFTTLENLGSRFSTLQDTANEKIPFAYINAIGNIDLSNTASVSGAQRLVIDYPSGIPLMPLSGHMLDVDVSSNSAMLAVQTWVRPIFVVIIWGSFIFGYLLHRGAKI